MGEKSSNIFKQNIFGWSFFKKYRIVIKKCSACILQPQLFPRIRKNA